MPQLPRVAVLTPNVSGVAALAVLLDSGLDATGLGRLTARAEALVRRDALTAHWHASTPGAVGAGETSGDLGGPDPVDAAALPVVSRPGSGSGAAPVFEISVDGVVLGQWDAVVATPSALAAVAPVVATSAPWFGGTFHPRTAGVYLVANAGPLTGTEPTEDDPRLASSQASWVSEYLRGRYALPAYQAMVDRPGLRRTGLRRGGLAGYLRAMHREQRAGRARAAAAGYPLPLGTARPA